MKLTIKLNIEEFQNIDFETNEYKDRLSCYHEIVDFLTEWVDYVPRAIKLRNHVVDILEMDALKGEKSVSEHDRKIMREMIPKADVIIHDNPKPLPKVVETKNYVDVRECIDYNEKSYKLVGYDNRYCWIGKSQVIRTESIEGGGTRVIVDIKAAWVITKLEWK